MTRKLAVVLVLAGTLVWCGAVMAEQQVVVMKNGQRLVGEVTKTAEGYEVKLPAGVIVIAEADVVRIEPYHSPQDEYQQRLDKADPKNADQLYEVAKWAADNNMLEQARNLLLKVLELKPQNEDARLRLRLIEARLVAASKSAVEPPGNGTGTVGPSSADGGTTEKVDLSMMIPMEDIYRIRLLELKDNDNVQIEFRNKLIDRFLKANRGVGPFADPSAEQEFLQLSAVAQTRYILQNTDRDSPMRSDILVKSDPAVFREFKTRIWPILAQTCANTSCHGSAGGAGALKLYNVALGGDRVMYTNFFILHSYVHRGRLMLDRSVPDDSLLLQYGLLPRLAKYDHPKDINPVFPTRDDLGFRTVLNWIDSLQYPLLPDDYGVKYKIPGKGGPGPGAGPSPEPGAEPIE